MRLVLGVLIGLALGAAAVSAGEALDYALFPPPLGLQSDDPGAIRAALEAIPTGGRVLMLAGWAIAAALGAGAAVFVARRVVAAEIVTVAALAFAVLYMSMSPSPWWMWAGALIAVPLAGWTAGRFALKKVEARRS
ncbi:MAG: hypothetical protein ABUL73_02995 [Alphaproteobacteria bacterium]